MLLLIIIITMTSMRLSRRLSMKLESSGVDSLLNKFSNPGQDHNHPSDSGSDGVDGDSSIKNLILQPWALSTPAFVKVPATRTLSVLRMRQQEDDTEHSSDDRGHTSIASAGLSRGKSQCTMHRCYNRSRRDRHPLGHFLVSTLRKWQTDKSRVRRHRQLHDNAGFNATGILHKLRVEHCKGSTWVFVNFENEVVADMMKRLIWEPALVQISRSTPYLMPSGSLRIPSDRSLCRSPSYDFLLMEKNIMVARQCMQQEQRMLLGMRKRGWIIKRIGAALNQSTGAVNYLYATCQFGAIFRLSRRSLEIDFDLLGPPA